jgi:putative glutamine amidotransferase
MTRNAPPLIGVTGDLSEASGRLTNHRESTLCVPQRYLNAIEHAGAIPLVLPANASPSALRRVVNLVDGLVITGGNFDIHPRYYGESPLKELGVIKARRTEFELEMTAAALARDLPILGICGGAQAINVALGGSLYQDIETQFTGARAHEQSENKYHGGHGITVLPGTHLHAIVRQRNLEVNTTHHQAVKKLGRGLVMSAFADDGIIEAIESARHRFVLGIQWHPEILARRKAHQRIFSCFVASCVRWRRS